MSTSVKCCNIPTSHSSLHYLCFVKCHCYGWRACSNHYRHCQYLTIIIPQVVQGYLYILLEGEDQCRRSQEDFLPSFLPSLSDSVTPKKQLLFYVFYIVISPNYIMLPFYSFASDCGVFAWQSSHLGQGVIKTGS